MTKETISCDICDKYGYKVYKYPIACDCLCHGNTPRTYIKRLVFQGEGYG